ncbi:hypothetical protein [Gracilimonas sp.]|uniref:hypothetical protein n=1 Tax=Gracilimonas sp. TaxID=1974203 RepID=UPI0028712C25|nr:hypothetical protein [Gracilimonas sp.]
MLKDKDKSNTSENTSKLGNSLQNYNETNSIDTEPDKQNNETWINLATTGVLSIFASIASTGFIAGVVETIFDIMLPFDNPIIQFLALVLTIAWWKTIRHWESK